MNNSKPRKTMSTIGLYKTDKGQEVFYDRFSKNAYVVKPSNLDKLFAYQNRFFLALAAIGLVYVFVPNVLLGIAGAVIWLVVVEVYFRIKVFKDLTCIPNFKPEHKVKLEDRIIESSDGRDWIMLVKSGLYLVLGILLVLNSFNLGGTLVIVVSGLIALIAVYFALMNLLAYLKVRGKKK